MWWIGDGGGGKEMWNYFGGVGVKKIKGNVWEVLNWG